MLGFRLIRSPLTPIPRILPILLMLRREKQYQGRTEFENDETKPVRRNRKRSTSDGTAPCIHIQRRCSSPSPPPASTGSETPTIPLTMKRTKHNLQQRRTNQRLRRSREFAHSPHQTCVSRGGNGPMPRPPRRLEAATAGSLDGNLTRTSEGFSTRESAGQRPWIAAGPA